jgi:hypothetical protein
MFLTGMLCYLIAAAISYLAPFFPLFGGYLILSVLALAGRPLARLRRTCYKEYLMLSISALSGGVVARLRRREQAGRSEIKHIHAIALSKILKTQKFAQDISGLL